jgi:hypothetical protein
VSFTQQPSAANAGASLGTVKVAILDQIGNQTGSTANVTLAIKSGTGDPAATLSGTTTVAAVAGVATLSGLSIDKAAAGYQLHATSGSLTTADSNAVTISPAGADHLSFTQQPSSANAGASLGTVKVAILDQYGNQTSSTANVTLAITSGTGDPAATLSGTTTVAAVAGVATFSGLSIDKAAAGYQLHATSGSLTTADSNAVTIGPAGADHLSFTQQPADAAAGGSLGTAKIAILDQYGNQTTSTANVTLAITSGTGDPAATLSGTTTAAAVSGVATFSGLSIDKAAGGYRLHATSGALTAADSSAFEVFGAPGLVFSAASGDLAFTGTTAYFRGAPGASGSVTLTATPAGQDSYAFADLGSGWTPAGGQNGASSSVVYAFTGAADEPGAVQVTYTVGGTPSAPATVSLVRDTSAPSPALTAPTDGSVVRGNSIALAATATDADAGMRSVGFYRCDATLHPGCDPTDTGAFGAVVSTDTNTADASFGASLDTSTLADGHAYRIAALATDRVGNTAVSASRTLTVDNSAPTVGVLQPTAVGGGQYQFYDALATTLWLNPAQTPSFTLSAQADDAESGIAKVSFPALFATAANDDTSGSAGTYTSATYTADGTSPGGVGIGASNGVTVPSAGTASAALTVQTDGAGPAAFSLLSPATGAIVRGSSIGVSATPADASSGLRSVDFVYCVGAMCSPSIPVGPSGFAAGIYSATLDTTALADGVYGIAAIATDNVGNTTTSSAVTVTVDNSAPTIAVAAPTSGANTSYDAGAKTLWLNAAASGTFRLTATAADPESGVAKVSFSALLGTAAHDVTGASPFQSDVYSFAPGSNSGTVTMTATNGVTVPSPRTAQDAITIAADGTAPNDTFSFPVDNGSYLAAGDWTAGCASAGLCGNVDDGGESGVASLTVALEDRTTGKWYDGASFASTTRVDLPATLAGTDWSYALGAAKLTAPHAYLATATATDNVGNAVTTAAHRFTFGGDVGAPTTTVTLAGASHAYLMPTGANAYNLYYGTANGGGSFTLHASATDPSGVDSVSFPDLSGAAGFSGSGGSSTNSSNEDPYERDSSSYSFASTATTPPAPKNVTSTDLRGNTGSAALTFLLDDSAPTGGSITAPATDANDYATTTSLAVTHAAYTADTGSGVASSTLTYATASLTDGACGGFGSETPVVDGAFTALDGTCYRFTLTGTDNVGNAATVTKLVKVDTTAPSQPAVSFSGLSAGNTFATGTTMWYRPSSGASFTVNADGSTDAESGIATYTFSGNAPQAANQLAVTPSGGTSTETVLSTNRAGLDSAAASYDVKADSTAPGGGTLTVNGGSPYLTSGSSVTIATTPYSDGGSGLKTESLTVESASLTNDTCGTFGSATDITGAASHSVSTATCYRFTLTATDNVGNAASTTQTVKVDTTAPVAPSVSFSNLSTGNTWDNGAGTLFYRPSAGGAFTVNANGASDPETGIKAGNAGYSFTVLSGFAGTTQTGNRVDVTFDGTSTGGGAQSVSALNNASIASTASGFTITADSGAPTGGLLSINPYSGSLSVAIAKTDFIDAVSGIASNALTRSDPQSPVAGVCPGAGYTGSNAVGGASDTVPTDGRCYEYTLTGTDHVGNSATFTTIVLVDTTGPTGGSISYVDGLASVNAIPVAWNPGNDPESGVGTVTIHREEAPLSGTTCGTFGNDTTSTPGSSPFVDTSVSAGTCYRYSLESTSNAGVASTFTSASVAKLTSASPITTANGNPAGVYLAGSTLWVGPLSANLPFKLQLTNLGRQGVDEATWRGKTGTLSSAPGSDFVANSAPFQSSPYTWDGTPGLNDTIAVNRVSGGADDTISVRSDTAAPSGVSISYAGGAVSSHAVAITTGGSDGDSGVASVLVERASAPLTGTTCGTWTAFGAVTLAGGSDTGLADETCYQYRVTVTDNVGNSAAPATGPVVEVPDITAPSFQSASTNSAGTQLTITMSENLDAASTPAAADFTVLYNGVAQPAPTGVSLSGSTVALGLPSAPNNSQTVTVRYAKGGSPLRDLATTPNEAPSFGPSAVVNATPDSVAPSVSSTSVNASTVTVLFNEALAGAAPDPSAFTVTTGGATRDVTSVSMSGKVVTLTLASAVESSESVAVAYAIPALNGLHDAAANAVAPFSRTAANQTPIVTPPTAGGGSGGSVSTPAPALVSASPADGSTVVTASTLSVTANQAGAWTHMTLTRPDGSVVPLEDASGQTATWPVDNPGEGLFVVRGTFSAGGKDVDVLSHFTIWTPPSESATSVPPVQKNAVPFAAGELKSSDGRTTLAWPAGVFSDLVVVEVAPTAASAVANLPQGSRVVEVNAFLRSTRAPIHDLGGVVDIRFASAGAGAHVVTSQDGRTWRDIPQLATLELPIGQDDGWFRDADQTVHVLTRHLTYYALVGEQLSTRLALRIITVRRLWLENRSFVAVRMSLTAPARVTGSFVGPDGEVVPGQTIKTPTRHAGVTILRVPLKVTKPGSYRLQMHAEGIGQVVNRTAKIRFLAEKPASPLWQEGAIRVAVVRGAQGLGSLDRSLGKRFVVEHVADAALYDAVDTTSRNAAAVVVVDLKTIPAYTLAGLHALLPEVRIVGLGRGVYPGVAATLPRNASPALVAKTIERLVR